jgi:hypothetical protein
MPYAEISLLKKFDQFKLVTMSLKESKDQILAHLREVCELGVPANVDIFLESSSMYNENLDFDDRDNRIEFLEQDYVYLEFDNFNTPEVILDGEEVDDMEIISFCFSTEEVRLMLDPGFKMALTLQIKSGSNKLITVKELMEAHPECFKKEEN